MNKIKRISSTKALGGIIDNGLKTFCRIVFFAIGIDEKTLNCDNSRVAGSFPRGWAAIFLSRH